jgi:hypothetical protein
VRVLQWRPRPASDHRTGTASFIRFPAIGDVAGRARYMPSETSDLTPARRMAIGRVLELRFAGMATAGPWSGQGLYVETANQHQLGYAAIPEEDLDFFDSTTERRSIR